MFVGSIDSFFSREKGDVVGRLAWFESQTNRQRASECGVCMLSTCVCMGFILALPQSKNTRLDQLETWKLSQGVWPCPSRVRAKARLQQTESEYKASDIQWWMDFLVVTIWSIKSNESIRLWKASTFEYFITIYWQKKKNAQLKKLLLITLPWISQREVPPSPQGINKISIYL